MQAWQQKDQGNSDWVIKHGTRSLIKEGMPESFSLLGFTHKPKVTVKAWSASKTVEIGGDLNLELELLSEMPGQKFVVDYAIEFVRANKKRSSKVFKWKNCMQDAVITLNKRHSFKKITTRKYYEGEHRICVLVNGEEVCSSLFALVDS